MTTFSGLFINLVTICNCNTEFIIRKTGEGYMQNDLEGSGRGMNEVLWQNMYGGTEVKVKLSHNRPVQAQS